MHFFTAAKDAGEYGPPYDHDQKTEAGHYFAVEPNGGGTNNPARLHSVVLHEASSTCELT